MREIRQQLGVRADGGDPSRYDEALRGRIEAFQRELGLRSDGLIGTLTLIGIQGHGSRSDVPKLVVSPISENRDVHHP